MHKSDKPTYPPKPGHPGKKESMPGRRVGRNPAPGTPRKVGAFGPMPKPKVKPGK